MSWEEEATVDHLTDPASIVIPRFRSLRITFRFLPAMIQVPFCCETVTGIPPHSSRDSCCEYAGHAVTARPSSASRLIRRTKPRENPTKGRKKLTVGATCL